ncbi:MAG: ATP-dependent Clp protease proteolytic subunit [Flavobacterium nitrogenifigens]|uniref:ATP-dependent Clp protease proteolytic subunit n=1 Tax=Flavobacterium nitrogenifigens TaxID=1617283 RepID=UPI0028084F8A|nr:ATP-dependent Clp protease proteolytic subunit [Flavobacterium nitrogenifigens]MDQ8012034.1 ATP-dependent Clp protease proteolytic subunit [Flavobacterium nitrogenifigens]
MKKRLLPILTASLIIAFGAFDVVAMSAKFPLSITAEAKEDFAEIRISGVIHQWQNSAQDFKRQIDDLIAKGIKNVKLYISTPGGSVFEANEIANEIKRFSGTVSGYGGALVASAGSYLALICDTFEMAENGQYMYHKPMGSIQGNEDKVAADLKLLQNLTNQYRTAYAEKTGLTEDEIESRWSKGDVWLSAKEALDQGFITSVSSKKEKITEDHKALFIACGAPTIPNVNSKKENNMKNRNELIAALKLPADATDEQILAAATKASEKAGTVEKLENEKTASVQKQAEELIDKAITTDKKITADVREQYIKFAVADMDGTKSILNSMPALVKPSANFDNGKNTDESRKDWTLEDYQKKDVKALEKMMIEDPEAFAKLEEAYFAS